MWKRRGLPDAWKWRLLTKARQRGLPLDLTKLEFGSNDTRGA